jgi:DNA topoisomerase-1
MSSKATLIIVESPTKAKTISSFLGKDYEVVSSYGHIRDLPKSKIGIEIENNFEPVYVIPPKAEPVIKDLQKKAKKSASVILATDEDREGEAIAFHLAEILGLISDKRQKTGDRVIKRIVFHEITKPAIESALENPRNIDMNLVNAQQGRRVLDRLVGYELSPFLWRKIKYGLSAGRVQSAALRLIVEREAEIESFKPDEYWSISARLAKEQVTSDKRQEFTAELYKIDNKPIDKLGIPNKDRAEEIVQNLKTADYKVADFQERQTKKNPGPPFTTSTLQQDSWNKLRYSSKQTMMLAQKLYEQGFITYMRTDSTNIAAPALQKVRDYVKNSFGPKYIPEKPHFYKTKSRLAQEAHEAIRPTDPFKTPESLKPSLDPKQYKVYDLIWKRFVASQTEQALFSNQTALIDANTQNQTYQLKANGQRVVFDGFLAVWNLLDKANTPLPEIQSGDKLTLLELLPEQHFTQPPPRFNDASIVKTLEDLGIGRPSTYASIISTIIERGYVERNEGRALQPTYLGKLVNEILVKHFQQIVDYQFTAKVEEDLDKIAENKADWRMVIREFYQPFHKNLEQKEQEVTRKEATEKPSDEICDKCGSAMVIKYGKYGPFLGCSKYPDCSNIKKLPGQTNEIGILCPECGKEHGGKVIMRRTKARKRLFYGCSRWPNCNFMSWKKPEEGDDKEDLEKPPAKTKTTKTTKRKIHAPSDSG